VASGSLRTSASTHPRRTGEPDTEPSPGAPGSHQRWIVRRLHATSIPPGPRSRTRPASPGRRPPAGPAAARPAQRRAPPVPGELALAAAWSWRILTVGLVAYFVVDLLARLPLVTVPLFLALLLAALLRGPALFLRRFMPQAIAALVVVLGAVVLVVLVVWFVTVRLQAGAGPTITQTEHILTQLRNRLSALPGIGGTSGDLVRRLDAWAQSHSSTLVSGAVSVGRATVDFLTALVLTIFLTLFFLIDGEREWSWLVRLAPRRAQPATNGAGHRAFAVLSGWITGTALIAVIHGVVMGLAMWLLSTPLIAVLIVLIVIGSFIPILGAVVFGGLSVLVTLVTVGLWPGITLLAVLVVSSLLEGHVYQPLIVGRSVRLHPVAILLALSTGALLGGIPGAVVAIPVSGAGHAAIKYLTGIEDIHGRPVRREDRMAPQRPPTVAWPGRPTSQTDTDGAVRARRGP
jgi:putative heme transporter